MEVAVIVSLLFDGEPYRGRWVGTGTFPTIAGWCKVRAMSNVKRIITTMSSFRSRFLFALAFCIVFQDAGWIQLP